jgi:hypothetical protein
VLELICTHSLSQMHKPSGAQVWRGAAVAATTTGIFGFGLEFILVMVWNFSWLWFGLYSWYASSRERYSTLVGYWFYGFLVELFSLSRLRCSGVEFLPMVG